MSVRPLTVGTRGSALALRQTASVVALLGARHPGLEIRTQRITTRGDALRDVPLSTLGGRGVFVDAIEDALRRGEIDLAVHSAKDLPSRIPADLTVSVFLERADPRDVLVSSAGSLDELPTGARVGTSSPRRAALVHALRRGLVTVDLRGNVDTRLRKLDAGEYDAILLAAAGLIRLGLEHRVTEWLPIDRMIPSPGQGAIAVEVRADDPWVHALVRPLAHLPTEAALTAERAFLARLGVGCAAAVAAHATVVDGQLALTAMIAAPDGRMVRDQRAAPVHAGAALGEALADHLLAIGGSTLIAECEREPSA